MEHYIVLTFRGESKFKQSELFELTSNPKIQKLYSLNIKFKIMYLHEFLSINEHLFDFGFFKNKNV
jgi:hypothetical protein